MKLFTKFSWTDLYKIPNILCYIRFLLIPVFLVQYIRADRPSEYIGAAAVVLASGLTDFLDGFIARRYNMITEFGKLIDPLADKLTQAALIFVLVVKIKWMYLLMIIFLLMQFFLLSAGLYMLKKGRKLNGAKWFGKISTTIFYATMLVLIAVPTLNETVTNILMLVCGIFLLLSFLLYINEYVKMYHEVNKVK